MARLSTGALVVTLVLTFLSPPLAAQGPPAGVAMSNRLVIKIGDKSFTATLLDNGTVAAFKALLPLSVTMTELNGNEKFCRLPTSLPTQASMPASIETGDLMLYGSSTLVLFYRTFSTTYSYTKLGQVDDTDGLASAVGSGNIAVRLEVQPEKR